MEYGELVEYYRGLIRLRKKLPGLCDKSPEAAARVMCRRIHGEGVVSFLVDNRASRPSPWEELFIVYNASDREWKVALPEQGCREGEAALQAAGHQAAARRENCEVGETEGTVWEILADGSQADCCRAAVFTVRPY